MKSQCAGHMDLWDIFYGCIKGRFDNFQYLDRVEDMVNDASNKLKAVEDIYEEAVNGEKKSKELQGMKLLQSKCVLQVLEWERGKSKSLYQRQTDALCSESWLGKRQRLFEYLGSLHCRRTSWEILSKSYFFISSIFLYFAIKLDKYKKLVWQAKKVKESLHNETRGATIILF